MKEGDIAARLPQADGQISANERKFVPAGAMDADFANLSCYYSRRFGGVAMQKRLNRRNHFVVIDRFA
jgi:hypothetical protein